MREVYGWVKVTRRGFLEYCSSLPVDVVTARREDFGHASMRGALIHIADCYRFWLAKTAFVRDVPRFEPRDYQDTTSIVKLFAETVDPLVDEFLAAYGGVRLAARLELRVPWEGDGPFVVSPLWLMTHVITHEFHHKGQVVALGRMLGHLPPETDLAAPGLA
ncbi:MAG: DinB family protein [Chloroflexota bacterium]|nr:DinB family protein [Chloroflexota bacterium]